MALLDQRLQGQSGTGTTTRGGTATRGTSTRGAQTSTRGGTSTRGTSQRGNGYDPSGANSPLPDWNPDMSRYPEINPGGADYDTSFLRGGSGGAGPGAYSGGDTSVEYGLLGPHTREVAPEETVQNQMEGLLSGDSVYMDQARQAGERAAAARGALSSSMFAGASQSAAIQSALPIAAQDAQTYSRVASENAAAINNNTLSKMQSMTQLAAQTIGANAQVTSAQIGAGAQVASAKIGAQTNMEISKMRINAEQGAREFMAAHDQVMSSINHGQNIELQNLDYGFKARLMQAGFTHDINMSTLGHEQKKQILDISHEYALDQIGYQGTVNDYLQDKQLRAGFLQAAMGNEFALHNTLSQAGLDEEGYASASARGQTLINDYMGMFNDLGGDGFNFDSGNP